MKRKTDAKKIIVESCAECPYQMHLYQYKVDHCDVEDRQIIDITTIPEWCLLEDAE